MALQILNSVILALMMGYIVSLAVVASSNPSFLNKAVKGKPPLHMFEYFMHPQSPHFSAIRSRLAQAYIEHKADIGAANARDEDIVGNFDNISAVLMATFLSACIDGRREEFVDPYGWFIETVADALNDVPRKLDS